MAVRPDSADLLVAGLGNPGPEYADTRHNAGFLCVDALAERLGARYWKLQDGALVAHAVVGRQSLLLVKPQTFMNLSGKAVRALCRRYGLGASDVIVVHDEMDFEPGDVRARRGGSAAGHNGVKSVYAELGSDQVVRVRVGTGRPPGRMDGAAYVLQHLKGAALEELQADCALAADVVESVIQDGLDVTMQRFNGRFRSLRQ